MSKCVVHMMKMKMSAMGGIQSHNQREHESKKNKEIDYEKSHQNYDVILDENINYQKTVKDRIAELNLKKSVRADAVVYSSFIISSDREFFYNLGYDEHIRKCREESENIAIGLEEAPPFDYMSEEYKNQCIADGSRRFFKDAAKFFCDRYGAENVINGTVHLDEATPHMHLGVIPITKDGRLSAKSIFTPSELKSLQTDFAKLVGAKYELERGIEGSTATHLDEVTFKLKQRENQLEELKEQVDYLNVQKRLLEADNRNLTKQNTALASQIDSMKQEKLTLEQEAPVLKEWILDAKQELKEIELAVKEKSEEGRAQYGPAFKYARDRARRQTLLEKFVKLPVVKKIFESFMKQEDKIRQQRKEKSNRGYGE